MNDNQLFSVYVFSFSVFFSFGGRGGVLLLAYLCIIVLLRKLLYDLIIIYISFKARRPSDKKYVMVLFLLRQQSVLAAAIKPLDNPNIM